MTLGEREASGVRVASAPLLGYRTQGDLEHLKKIYPAGL